ncbi:MAG: carbohydrate kinase [Chitinophagaceae bacterium]|nr:MAG: carbohydrate kinase [Chitinophagaceae bacterium]
MYLLGIDVGTSAIKVAVVEIATQKSIASAYFPETEAEIKSVKQGWAEQSPADWWLNTQQAILKLTSSKLFDAKQIKAIGIAYQMHGLVAVDENQNVLRDSIIWCDSRAVDLGDEAFEAIGKDKALIHLLNSPGNFTASKLAWVKENEPLVYNKIDKIMLPGDFIAMKFTGEITTSIPALSEGIFWDFKNHEISKDVMDYYELDYKFIPAIKPLFSSNGNLSVNVANDLGLSSGIPINTFAHVTYSEETQHTGVLLCINGTGSLYRWAKNNFAPQLTYPELNQIASKAPIGSNALFILPFGNGAERMLNNKFTGAQLLGIDLNVHTQADIFRAVQESIAFAFRYGLDIMRENGMQPKVIKAGKTNLFLSDVFAQTFVDVTGIPVELYENDGSVGAALGAGIGARIFENTADAFTQQQAIDHYKPKNSVAYEPLYQQWKTILINALK